MGVHVTVCFGVVSAMYLIRENFFEPCAVIIDYILLCSCVTGHFVRSVRVHLICVVQSDTMKQQSIFLLSVINNFEYFHAHK
jgi:hypothetical protein